MMNCRECYADSEEGQARFEAHRAEYAVPVSYTHLAARKAGITADDYFDGDGDGESGDAAGSADEPY